MIRKVHLLIRGRVQGVFFRSYVKEKADAIGLKGHVRNLPNGVVEVIVQGEEHLIKHFVEKCYVGPKYARVDEVKVAYEKTSGGFNEFVIKH